MVLNPSFIKRTQLAIHSRWTRRGGGLIWICVYYSHRRRLGGDCVIGQGLIEIMELWVVLGLSKDYSDCDN